MTFHLGIVQGKREDIKIFGSLNNRVCAWLTENFHENTWKITLRSSKRLKLCEFGARMSNMIKDINEDSAVLNGDKRDTAALRDQGGRFLPGRRLGRPPGSISESTALRDRLIQTVSKLDDEAEFPEYGGDFLLYFAKKYPEKFMGLIASLLPKKLLIKSEHLHAHIPVMDLPEKERAAVFAECRARVLSIRGYEIDVPRLNEKPTETGEQDNSGES